MISLKEKYIRLTQENRYNNCPNPLVALTGGIATGKSKVSNFFREKGLHLMDADALIHEIYKKEKTRDFIQGLCPQALKKGAIDFPTLRSLFFSQNELKERIEYFLYPQLKELFEKKIPPNPREVIVYDIPLLFEKEKESLFDQIIVVTLDEKTQLKRLQQRDGGDRELHRRIIASQFPLSEKITKANFVIDNGKSWEETKRKASQLFFQLFEKN